MAEEVPEGRCGFTLLPVNLPVDAEIDVDSLEDWYEWREVASCLRDPWDGVDSGRCIWHADLDEKPANELVASVCKQDRQLDGAVLRGVEIRDALPLGQMRLGCADLTGANFRGAGRSSADPQGFDLSEAYLREANLSDTDLRGADLSDAYLRDANLSEAYLRHADLSNADLRDGNLSDAYLRHADLSRAKLPNANLFCSKFWHADLSETVLWQTDLTEANLQNADLTESDLQRAELTEANLWDVDLTDANLKETTLVTANLERANLTRANLFGADLRGANFYGAILTDVQFDATTTFGGHYTDEDGNFDPDESAWMFRQLQRLFRENAHPKQARQAYLAHKDVRRKEQWATAPIPEPVRKLVWRTKVGYWQRKRVGKMHLYKLLKKGERENEETDELESNDEAEDQGGEDNADPITEPWLERPTEIEADSRPASLLALFRWARTATSGVVMRYGESPWRVVGVSLFTVLGFGLLYPFVGGMKANSAETEPFEFTELVSLSFASDWAKILFENLYFSAVTFTTLGYGDIQPASQAARLLASVESLLGALLMALLVFVLGRRTTW